MFLMGHPALRDRAVSQPTLIRATSSHRGTLEATHVSLALRSADKATRQTRTAGRSEERIYLLISANPGDKRSSPSRVELS